jgi:hypothetical protein
MKATQKLYDLGQSLWLDNITRNLLNSGLLQSYINELSRTGLTSNPTIFDHAIKNSTDYDAAIRNKLEEGKSGTCSVQSMTGPAAWMVGFRWKSPLYWLMIQNHARRGRGTARQSEASQPFYQDSWDQGRLASHRRSDLRWCAG